MQLKGFTLAVEFQIELKEFKQFTRHLKTDKYISTTEWETIIRKVEDTLDEFNKCHAKSKHENNCGVFTTDDESLAIDWRFKPKTECCINFDKLNLRNCFDWIMHIKIRRAQPHNILDQKPNTPDLPTFANSDNEYDPTGVANLYKASKKTERIATVVKSSYEYSPKSLNSPDRKKKGLYTPSKIVCRSQSRSAKKGDGIFDDDSDDDVDDLEKQIAVSTISVEKSSKSSVKRKLDTFQNPQDDVLNQAIIKTSTKKATKKLKSGDLSGWATIIPKKADPKPPSRSSSSSSNVKKSAQTKTAGGGSANNNIQLKISDEDRRKMIEFTEQVKRDQIEREKRRIALESVELKHCREISNTKLKR